MKKIKEVSPLGAIIAKMYDNFGATPIYGGRGYSQNDAIIIDKYDIMIDNDYPFNGIGLEYALIRYRNWIEFIGAKQEGEQYAEIDFDMIEQKLILEDDNIYDYIKYEVSCFLHSDYTKLEEEWNSKYGSSQFDENEHFRQRAKKRKFFVREAWFEISSFYGEYTPYNWDALSGPFFRRTDGTLCPIEPASFGEKITLKLRNSIRRQEEQYNEIFS